MKCQILFSWENEKNIDLSAKLAKRVLMVNEYHQHDFVESKKNINTFWLKQETSDLFEAVTGL